MSNCGKRETFFQRLLLLGADVVLEDIHRDHHPIILEGGHVDRWNWVFMATAGTELLSPRKHFVRRTALCAKLWRFPLGIVKGPDVVSNAISTNVGSGVSWHLLVLPDGISESSHA